MRGYFRRWLFFYLHSSLCTNDLDERKELWQSLQDSYISFNLANRPWMVSGDFNEILSPQESSNTGFLNSTSAMRQFGACLADMGLFDMACHGPEYTWSNHRPLDPISKKLDRCLINDKWLLLFPSSHCTFEAPEFSDHAPGHVKLFTPPPQFGTRPFRFFNFVATLPSFMECVKVAWEASNPPALNLKSLGFKLKSLKRPLKSLCKDKFSNLELRVIEANDELKSIQLQVLNVPTPANLQLERTTRDNWMTLRRAEESFFRQRSRIKWLGEGDFDTRFFHLVTKARNASNAIKYLKKADGTRTTTPKEVHLQVQSYYEGIYNNLKGDYNPFLPIILDRIITHHCSLAQQMVLKRVVSSDCITTSLFKMPLNKTPGPDGFPVEFFKASWAIIGPEVICTVKEFFASAFMPKSLNSTNLVLIPKRRGADELQDFRPISCLNTLYKLITRLISDRLKSILPEIILPNQTAFIRDRLLLENVLLAAEVINGYHRKDLSPRITLKIDIAKAFDSMRWDFILACLTAYRLPRELIGWVKTCISSPVFSVSINGLTSGYFKGRTGLRQGDPLSPILFVMAMNVLSLMLNRAAIDGIFNYHPGCKDVQLTHLSFADDLLIFVDGSSQLVAGVFTVLSQFEKMSGLAVNISKTSLFCSGVSDTTLLDLSNRFSLTPGSLPIRYLGLPLCSKKLSVSDCDPLISKIRMKMNSWMHRPLSLAGRLRLLSSIISGLIGFWTQAFFLPKAVIKKINALCSSFLWHGKLDNPT
ncbi:unnamed protein product [Microthlaspi erraticum]|uniref:Reverse transcriptase domain-containing protein n=1 Tax=Microthlaspi erraticum TaxID=1685480 RepID=A0A6D2KAT8_9BRAS|nr:unnamed protein product [Microthlaspi erraticum]